MNEVEKLDEISGSLVQQVIFPLMQSASACTNMCSNRSRVQEAADNVWVHLYDHFHV